MENLENETAKPKCIICKSDEGTDFAGVRTKGFGTLKAASNERGDGKLKDIDPNQLMNANNECNFHIHKSCQQIYTNKGSIAAAKKRKQEDELKVVSPVKKRTRTSSTPFNWSNSCFLCSKPIKIDDRHKDRQDNFSTVTLDSTRNFILEKIENLNDEFYRNIRRRLMSNENLVESGAIYHTDCFPKILRHVGYVKQGNPKTPQINEAMEKIFDYIEENSDYQFSLSELKKVLTDYVPDDKTIKTRIIERYKNNIIVTCKQSKLSSATLFCFKNKLHDLLSESYQENKSENDLEKRYATLKSAAEYVRSDIRTVVCENQFYPPSDNMFNELNKYIPDSLLYFLNEVICKGKDRISTASKNSLQAKCTSISHAIMSAVRPKSFLSPLQLSLAVTLHRKFGSKQIINICNYLGFCSSYHEATLYESSLLYQDPLSLKPGTFIQFVHDNADFDTNTIDGRFSFHYMGCIQIMTPKENIFPQKPIPRLKKVPTEAEINRLGNNTLLTYHGNQGDGLKKIIIKIPQDFPDYNLSPITGLHTLWLLLKYDGTMKMGWNGFMENLTKQKNFSISRVVFSPFINASASDYNTIYTSLKNSAEFALDNNMRTAISTFDQPLYIKARDIISNVQISDQILSLPRLGGFHTILSFLGCIGYIMGGSGLKEALSLIYAENSVDHILSGKAYGRAIRAHTLLQQALSQLIFDDLVESDAKFRELILGESRSKIFDELLHLEEVCIDRIKNNEDQLKLNEIFQIKLMELEKKSKTAKLWVSYFKMVTLLKTAIASERMGDWKLHLESSELMLPYFHAAGHLPYAKSLQVYIQDMKGLSIKMDPVEFNEFTNEGYFTARRSKKYFSGIHSDQTIEQTLMKSMKIVGGPFKRSGGATDSVVYKWVKGVVFCQDIIDGMESFCNISFEKSFQHVDARDARVTRDEADVKIIKDWLQTHSPFSDVDAIMSIATGAIGEESINCHDALEIGIASMKKMNGQNFKDLKLKRKDRVLPLLFTNSKVKIHDKEIPLNPLVLFQRICILKKTDEELKEYLTYELAPYPMSLFDEGQMRKTQKSTLYNIFEECTDRTFSTDNFHFVVDGGMLLHRIRWQLKETFSYICGNYVRYILRNYGNNAIIVFDGYEEITTKAVERSRRALTNSSVDILFTEDMELNIAQAKFLANNKNKQRFINLLKKKLSDNNIFWKQEKADADRQIVNTALEIRSQNVAVISEDIDVLVILTALCPSNREIFFLKPSKGKIPQKIYSSKSLINKYPNCQNYILFLHAFTGCDTTSTFFRKGKNIFAKILSEEASLQRAAAEFYAENQKTSVILNAGVKCILALYGAPQSIADLNSARYEFYVKASTKQTLINLSSLPPSTDAALQHLKRVYCQVQLWLGNSVEPELWGWERKNNTLVPVPNTKPLAPENLLKMVFCNCKGDKDDALHLKACKSCTCKKAGLYCTLACRGCNGQSCLNVDPSISAPENEEDEEGLDYDEFLY